jgi:WD40 repeat protein
MEAPLYTLRGHDAPVNSVSFVSDTYLASGSLDGQMKLWNLRTRRALTLQAHTSSVLSVGSMFVPASISEAASGMRHLISSGRDGFVKLWDMSTFGNNNDSKEIEPLSCYETGAQHFCNIAIDRDYHSLANIVLSPCMDESQLCIIDNRCKDIVHAFKTKKEYGMITSIFFATSISQTTPNTDVDCSALKSALANMNDEDEGKDKDDGEHSKIPASVFNTASTSELSQRGVRGEVIVGFEDGSVSHYDLRYYRIDKDAVPIAISCPSSEPKYTEQCHVQVHDDPVFALDYYRDTNGSCILWSGGAGKSVHKTVLLSSTTSKAVQSTHDEDVEKRGLNQGVPPVLSPSSSSEFTLPSDAGTACLCLSSSRKIAALANWDGLVRLVDTKSCKEVTALNKHRENVFGVAFGVPNGATEYLLASASKDHNIAIWDTKKFA